MAREPARMSSGGVDDVLVGIDSAVGELVASSADSGTPQIAVADESIVDYDGSAPRRDPEASRWPNPLRALRLARGRLANDLRMRRADAARELAAWGADLASVALVDAAAGRQVYVVRAAVGDPSAEVSDEDLPQLPGTSFRGEDVSVDQATLARRRDLIWGTDWTRHRVPALPSVTRLSDLLTRCGVAVERVSAVRQARKAIADALSASDRVAVSEQADDALGEIEQTERLTGLLIDYTRLLTTCLREISSPAGRTDAPG